MNPLDKIKIAFAARAMTKIRLPIGPGEAMEYFMRKSRSYLLDGGFKNVPSTATIINKKGESNIMPIDPFLAAGPDGKKVLRGALRMAAKMEETVSIILHIQCEFSRIETKEMTEEQIEKLKRGDYSEEIEKRVGIATMIEHRSGGKEFALMEIIKNKEGKIIDIVRDPKLEQPEAFAGCFTNLFSDGPEDEDCGYAEEESEEEDFHNPDHDSL